MAVSSDQACLVQAASIGRRTISKLMSKDEARKEMKEMSSISSIVHPNSTIAKHILLYDSELCVPEKFTAADFQGFNKDCAGPLRLKKRMSRQTFNDQRYRYRVINMTDGGLSISDLVPTVAKEVCRGDKKGLVFFNNKVIELLKDAIYPMNKLGLIHLDVKPANLVINKERAGSPIALIDWGLASPGFKNLGSKSFNKPIQYNLPFTSMLLNDNINRLLSLFHYSRDNSEFYNDLAEFVFNHSVNANVGHLSVIKDSINYLDRSLKPETVITKYLAAALRAYTRVEGSSVVFEKERYLSEVFAKNADVWGTLCFYVDLLDNCHKSSKLINRVRAFLIRFMFSPRYSATPIPEMLLIKAIKELTKGSRKTARRRK